MPDTESHAWRCARNRHHVLLQRLSGQSLRCKLNEAGWRACAPEGVPHTINQAETQTRAAWDVED